jgi:hypothetical protein
LFCVSQDACLDSVITHPLQPTFIDRVAGKSMVVAKATTAKKHSNDDEKCHRNGLRLIAMAWEMFDGSAPETRVMIHKITIRHADKHNQPQRTDHLPDQSAPFRRIPARRWGTADYLRVRRLIASFAVDTSDG